MSGLPEDSCVPPIPDEVSAVFDAASPEARRLAVELRALIYRVAAAQEEVPGLTESLKWGEPSYAPSRPRIGTSVRIKPRDDGSVGLMFICHTDIVSRFRDLYADELEFEANRAIILRRPLQSEGPVSHCVAMALMWHSSRRTRKPPVSNRD